MSRWAAIACLGLLAHGASAAWADEPLPPVLTLKEEVRLALDRAPEATLAKLAAIRSGEAVRETRALNRPQISVGTPGHTAPIDNALEEMAGISSTAYNEIRQSIYGMRTMVSASLGFVPTLTELQHEFSAQKDILVNLKVDGAETVRLSPASEPQVIRIVQEALNNVRKHAQVDRARVCVERKEGWLCVSVQDDGRGFDPAKFAAPNSLHFGLQGMRERAEGLGGKLEVVTAPGQGTCIMAQLPLERLS